MNITIISAVFPPEPIISAQTSYDIALELSQQSHNVKVVTNFPNRPEGKLFPGYSRKLIHKEIYKSKIILIRCFSIFSKESSIISRSLENISFGFFSGLYLLFSKSPDLIYANTWPIFATGIVRLIASIKRIPLIISVQDVYPESLIVQRRIANSGLLVQVLSHIDYWIAKGSSRVITIANVFSDIYKNTRQVEKYKIFTIPNWVDKNKLELVSKKIFREEVGISLDAVVIGYGGNIGVAAGLEKVIKELEYIESHKKIFFVIAGSGSLLEECKRVANEKPWFKFIFHTPWKQEETSKVLAAADILILPTSGDQSLVSVPSKLITYMLASRPVLAVCDENSEVNQIIQASECGWLIQPAKLQDINNLIKTIIELPESLLLQKGVSGREYALKNFTSEVCLPKVIDVITSALPGRE